MGTSRGDPTRLRQVITNLLSNAVKFTDTGTIEIIADRDGDDVHFCVSDSGMGMAPETVDRLFEKFVQADATTTRRFGGTGLGLAICRDLVEIMGGRLSVESSLGRGSRLLFNLPLPLVRDAVAHSPEPQASVATSHSLRILAAEDNQINQRVLEAFLGTAGYTAVFVETGVEAVENVAGVLEGIVGYPVAEGFRQFVVTKCTTSGE